jgi:hypothetical protein
VSDQSAIKDFREQQKTAAENENYSSGLILIKRRLLKMV